MDDPPVALSSGDDLLEGGASQVVAGNAPYLEPPHTPPWLPTTMRREHEPGDASISDDRLPTIDQLTDVATTLRILSDTCSSWIEHVAAGAQDNPSARDGANDGEDAAASSFGDARRGLLAPQAAAIKEVLQCVTALLNVTKKARRTVERQRARAEQQELINRTVLKARRLDAQTAAVNYLRLASGGDDKGGGGGGSLGDYRRPCIESLDLRAADAQAATEANTQSAQAPTGRSRPSMRPPEQDPPRLVSQLRCYVCKQPYRILHWFYARLCPRCAAFNVHKRRGEGFGERWETFPPSVRGALADRLLTRPRKVPDLTGKVVVVTGCRVKVGLAICAMLLRRGAVVVGTTRFPHDCLRRLQQDPDFRVGDWAARLHLYAVDFRDVHALHTFCDDISTRFPALYALINNAAQTVARPREYYAPLVAYELKPDVGVVHLAERAACNGSSVDQRHHTLAIVCGVAPTASAALGVTMGAPTAAGMKEMTTARTAVATKALNGRDVSDGVETAEAITQPRRQPTTTPCVTRIVMWRSSPAQGAWHNCAFHHPPSSSSAANSFRRCRMRMVATRSSSSPIVARRTHGRCGCTTSQPQKRPRRC